MDGVVFNTESVWRDAFVLANKRFHAPLTERDRQAICGKSEETIRAAYKRLCPDLDVDAYRDYTLETVKEEISRGHYEIKPGFGELMAHLRERGVKTALATSSHRDRAALLFEKKGMRREELFSVTVCSEDAPGHSKPDPYLFLLAAERLGLDPDSCCVIEDSVNGIAAAERGGFLPVMVVDLIEPDAFCRAHARVCADLRDVMKLI